ncbi:hypothetical protein [Larkinella terrae]|uniref:Uncharacterized protein n=1 Tax=Larkinella terrae TaxID=2025311 RepID=A0A7K0EGA5_9BACT|nr:hypothetical protein [Larkinella terrae]MRS60476.1 hypothetical protein [Larkinella terrae]
MKKSTKLILIIIGLLLVAYWIMTRSGYEVDVMKLPPETQDTSRTAR